MLEVWLDAPVGGARHDELLSTIAQALRRILTSVCGSGNSSALPTDPRRLPLLRRPGGDDSPVERSARALFRLFQFVAFKLPAADDAIVDLLLPVFAPAAADLARISAAIAKSNVDAILHWHDRDGTDAMVRLDRRTQGTLRDVLARTAFGLSHRQIKGRLVGISMVGRCFEIQTPDAVVAGRVADALVDRLGSWLGCQVVATLEVSTAHLLTDGRIRESVSLIDVAGGG